MEFILETQNLEKIYKKNRILNNVNIHIEKGAIYGLIGKNGAGKTTLMRLICGLQKPTSGIYLINNIPNTDKKIIKERRKMGGIIESPTIYLNMTAEENLKEQYKIIGKNDMSELQNILKLIGLSDTKSKKTKNFSLGMKQRLGIGIALVGNPNFLILDEPINGLDPNGIIEIRELILRLNKENKISFLISSHYLDELSKIATNYGFLNNGRIIQEITKDDLENNCKKRIEITVNNIKKCEEYLKQENINFKIISNDTVDIYDKINIFELAVNLSNKNCKINDFHKKEDTLENYYINLIGGKEND